MPVSRRALVLVTALVCSATFAQAQRGALTAHRNLAQLTQQAETIVEGTVISAKAEPHPSFSALQTVVVTLRVSRTLKGQPGGTLTFRQFIWDMRDRYTAAGYRRGQSLLLFLNKPNESGLTSPAGMEQGRFRLLPTAAGRPSAVNGNGNAALLQGVSQKLAKTKLSSQTAALLAQHRSGPISLDQLEELILQIEKTR